MSHATVFEMIRGLQEEYSRCSLDGSLKGSDRQLSDFVQAERDNAMS